MSAKSPTESQPNQLHMKKPEWLKTPIPTGAKYFEIKRDLRDRKLFTVCEEAKCPNIAKCWGAGTATFMILGDTCTRACRFCHVKTGNPQGWLDHNEPEQTAESAARMGLSFAVITMVDRDDLPDGGAAHAAKVIRAVRARDIGVEFLSGDFRAKTEHIETILAANMQVFAHNIETVQRLTPRVRDARASYLQSLETLRIAKEHGPATMRTKTGLMLGLGETLDEVQQALRDARSVGVSLLTLGQYMRPTKAHLSIKRWVPPAEFDQLAEYARSIGFSGVASGPLIRSSFKAGDLYRQALGQ
jgi:lipoic acid synthetase